MAVSLESKLKLEQNLSAQMLQSLALLHMPVTELSQRINEEIESNPALEIPDREFRSEDSKENSYTILPDDRLDDADPSDYESFFSGSMSDSDYSNQALENTSASGETLQEHLEKQLGECTTTDKVNEIALMLISNLDANGFFYVDLETLFQDKGYEKKDIEESISLVQSFEPYGVCVKDFRQSLIVQAKCIGLCKEDLIIFSDIVNNHLKDIKDGKVKETALSIGTDKETVERLWNFLKTLTPYPGRNYSSTVDAYIVPEFSIRKKDCTLVLDINTASIPALVLSESFESLASQASDKQSRDSVKEYINRANTFIYQVDMRYKTIAKAARVLMEAQRDFFLYGSRYLKALTLKEVADRIGVHETTMSRLAQSKWVDTDWGVFQMKYFFSQGVAGSGNDGTVFSRNAVKEIIAQILKDNPALSDQKVSDELLSKGIKCARRTVNKYRSEIQ